MFDDYDDYNIDINQAIDNAKQMAIEAYKKDLSKKETISYVVGSFVLTNLSRISPRPKLLKRYYRGEHVSFNMILDSIDEKGILIGATAYRLAEQLETELVDNGVKSKVQSTAVYVNGQLRPEMSSWKIPISVTYLKYFEQHLFSIIQQYKYWGQRIIDTTPEDDHVRLGMLKGYSKLHTFCLIPQVSLFIYNKIKRLISNADTKADIEDLVFLRESITTQLDQYNYDCNNNEHRATLLAISCITAVIDEFIYLAKMQE